MIELSYVAARSMNLMDYETGSLICGEESIYAEAVMTLLCFYCCSFTDLNRECLMERCRFYGRQSGEQFI
ncbi:MAG: hypothetical protein PHD01_13830, partial [Geobacteraceae bacterium]|nr:hypothetical protein [Geobacteraceae bacterium]